MREATAREYALKYLNDVFKTMHFNGDEPIVAELMILLQACGGCDNCEGQGLDSGSKGRSCGNCGRLLGVVS